jgi:hypothetical protein
VIGVLLLCAIVGPQDPGAGPCLERRGPDRAVLVGERVDLELRFGIPRAQYEEELVQPFRQPLDVPVQLRAAWPAALLRAVPPPPSALRVAGEGGASWVLPGGTEVRGGVEHLVFTQPRRVVPDAPGPLELAAPALRFGVAAGWVDYPVQGRVPAGLEIREAIGETLHLEVLPLPPGADAGAVAVGRFELRAERGAASADGHERWVVTVNGTGDFEHLPAPRLEGASHHELGRLREASPDALRVAFELARVAGADDPVFVLDALDPQSGELRRLVHPPEAAASRAPVEAAPPTAPEVAEEASPAESRGGPDPWTRLFLVALFLGPVALVGVVFLGWQRRRGPAPSPAAAAAHPAPATTAMLPSAPPNAVGDPLDAALVARLGCPPAALVGPGLAARLEAAGAEPGLAARAAALHAERLGARYGGPPVADEAARLAAVLEGLRGA